MTRPQPSVRLSALAAIALAHAAGFAAISFAPLEVPVGVRSAIALRNIPEVHRVVAAAPVVTLGPVTATVAAPTIEVEAFAEASGDCAVLDSLQASLDGDASVAAALGRLPHRSANALMVWDGRWLEAGPLGGTVADNPIRRVIVDRLAGVDRRCRDAEIVGPRLLVVAGAAGPTALALGSGRWRFAEMIAGETTKNSLRRRST